MAVNVKQGLIPVVPRNLKIVNTDGTVTRSGQLLLEQLQTGGGPQQGSHAERPDPLQMPDGALYVEADRSVLYYVDGGEWHYVAGTMWGTLSPDQRPVDLGPNDAGFDFRTIVAPPRQFMWSGNSWIEITALRYGTHAERLATPVTPSAGLWSGAAWIETDRGYSIYQNQAGTWHYVAGTMFGTLSPDQRPTDLGVNDAGFDFRTSVNPPREFLWSQTAWVEITPLSSPGILPSSNPGPGSQRLWYDPADLNRVKYAP